MISPRELAQTLFCLSSEAERHGLDDVRQKTVDAAIAAMIQQVKLTSDLKP